MTPGAAGNSVGAWLDDRGAHFRLWAPSAARVELLVEGFDQPVAMTPAGGGIFASDLTGPSHGRHYRYRVDGRGPFPDPASRWQPDGVHGESALDDPRAFAWHAAPPALARRDLVLYELHTGTFTADGTFDGARGRLPYLRDLGITAVELMPIAEFAGSRNWGYDGAALFAPSSVYGGPAGLRRFVDAAHQLGLAVILDIVYNHLGPDGAYLGAISPEFFARDEASPWGAAVNLADPAVRAWLTANAIHWAVDYHVDGFRLDATHALPQAHAPAFIRGLVRDVRGAAGRDVIFIAEDHRNLAEMLRPAGEGGWGLDAVWTDDFHHHVRVLAAGDSHGYYRDYRGNAGDLAETIRRGWFFAGQHSAHLGEPRGTDPSALAPEQFVYCIQNHDQIGNRAHGDRLHHTAGLDVWRAASALLLLAPETPLLFMGQEWAATTPFQYFTDHHEELGRLVTDGRRGEFQDFPAFRERPETIPDPQDEATFDASKLRWEECAAPPHAGVLALHRALLGLRRSDPLTGADAFALDGETVALSGNGRALVARLKGSGRVPLAPRLAGEWRVVLTTEDPEFAEDGAPPVVEDGAITFARPSAVVFARD
ncbi:MAG TPA: malto-oligosyltrehalose trehalohydrolase [Vicinamibacterales bacterium]|nr:malto-oligosyltrehalose trehalohydrolase [Vicinamibacterales bacterium]